MKKNIFLLTAFFIINQSVYAENLIEGDVEAGKSKSITCVACHGQDGNSINPIWPNIAGQHASYIFDQLKAFKNGLRNQPLMLGQVMLLTDSDMQNLAAYYSTMPQASQNLAQLDNLELGTKIYRGGNQKNGSSACIACHGPTGKGNPAAKIPSIRGQHAVYLADQLKLYASGERQSDSPTNVMRDIAKKLTNDEINAVSSYMQGLN